MNKKLLIVGLAALLLAGVFGFGYWNRLASNNQIQSYEECVASGNPVSESYPPVCTAQDGRIFIQDIGNELEYADEIIIESPRPNQEIASPLDIEGRAIGPWYFEADFPVELFDGNGNRLAIGIMQAQGEWMTEDFVPFRGRVEFGVPDTPSGTLVAKNSNPSGLPEMSKSVTIPVRFRM